MVSKSLHDSRIAVLGCGSLGSSLVNGLLTLGLKPEHLLGTSRRAERCAALGQQFGIRTTSDNLQACRDADVVILAAKPQQFAELCDSLADLAHVNRLFISVAAGIEVGQICAWLAQPVAVVRAMPNTPSAIGYGATGLFADQRVSSAQRQIAEQLFSAVGRYVWLDDEKWMNWVTALSGSGPAYFYQLMETMVSAAVQAGFPADAAELLVKQTALGAAQLANSADAPPLSELIRRVRSPGGTTEQALNTLAAHDFAGMIAAMLHAAEKRGAELSAALKS